MRIDGQDLRQKSGDCGRRLPKQDSKVRDLFALNGKRVERIRALIGGGCEPLDERENLLTIVER
jgi:hypothetical protein